MGLFNTYGTTQLKVSDDLRCAEYAIGDAVDIPDGVYVGWGDKENGGVVVIHKGKLVVEFGYITTTYGFTRTPDELIDGLAP